MADNFSKFKKRYQEGKVKEMAMPPIVPGPAGLARSAAGVVARPLLRYLQEGVKSAAESASKANKGGKPSPKSRGGTGTFTDKLGATRTRPRTKKESEKFGPLAKRQENLPAKQNRAIVKREENVPATRTSDSRALSVARDGKGNRAVVNGGARTFGDKGQGGRIVGLSTKGKLAAGAVGAGAAGLAYAGYKKADDASATDSRKKSNAFAKSGPAAVAKDMYKGAPRQIAAVKAELDDRSTTRQGTSPENKAKGSSSVGGTKNGPFKSEFAKRSLQGRKASPVLGKTGGSSVKATASKMTNFERQKARQLEKEGYGGRSMTREGAKKQVMKERSYKFKDLFK